MLSIKALPLATLFALALSGCVNAPVAQTGSYVGPLQTADSKVLARAMTSYLHDRLPPAASTLTLVPPPSMVAPHAGPGMPTSTSIPAPVDPLTQTLTQDLKTAGFALSTPEQKLSGAHRIQYVVEPFNGGILLNMKIDGYSASQFFVRDTVGVLLPSSPFSVQETSNE